MPPTEPDGDLVTSPDALHPDKNTILSGPYGVTLVPTIAEHISLVYPHIAGPKNAYLWRYLPNNAPLTPEEAQSLSAINDGEKFFLYTIFVKDPHTSALGGQPDEYGAAVGLIGLLNIVPQNRSIEVGHVLFGSVLQRTTAATVAIYLLMKHAFDDLHYERVEWKANNLNEPSKRAALRLGFVSEGLFRKHMVIKGRRRDTWWGSVVDDEWNGSIKKALGLWLEPGNFDGEGKQKRKLEQIREALGRLH